MFNTIIYQIIIFLVNLTCLFIITGPHYIFDQIKNRIIIDAVKLIRTGVVSERNRAIKLILVVLVDCSLPFSVILVLFEMMVLPYSSNFYFYSKKNKYKEIILRFF